MQICVQFHFKSEIGTIKKNRKEETQQVYISIFLYISISGKDNKFSTVLVLFIRSIDEF